MDSAGAAPNLVALKPVRWPIKLDKSDLFYCKYAANSPIWVMDGTQASPQNGLQLMGRFCTAGLQRLKRTTLRSGYIPMTNPIRNLIGMLVLGAPLSLLAASDAAQITISPYRPVISLAIYGSFTGTPDINIFAGSRGMRHCLDVQVEESERLQLSTSTMVGQEMDIYVGVLSPNQRVRTWTPVGIPYDPRMGVLNDGIFPYAQKYIPEKGFRLFGVKLESICIAFSNDDPIGHYSWFVWLIKGGKPLNNPQNWIGLGSIPFFLVQ